MNRKDPYQYFRVEARELSDALGRDLLALERAGAAPEIVARLLRHAHTLKGAARVMKLPAIADKAHAVEDRLAPFREGGESVPRPVLDATLALLDGISLLLADLDAPPSHAPSSQASPIEAEALSRSETPRESAALPPDSVSQETATKGTVFKGPGSWGILRHDMEDVDAVLERMSEATVNLAALKREMEGLVRALPSQGFSVEADLDARLARFRRSAGEALDRTDRSLRQAHERTERLRLVPAESLFDFLARVVRDAAAAAGKAVRFETAGGERRLDAPVLSILQEGLLHLVRNAVAHGIENAGARKKAGKPVEGRVRVEVEQRGGRLCFVCSDDGAGLDAAAIRVLAVAKGILPVSAPDPLPLADAASLLLRGGLSTADSLSELSGRGIGLDAARACAERLRGDIRLESRPGSGTRVEIEVPISLSTFPVLAVETDGVPLLIPFRNVRQVLRVAEAQIARSPGGDTVPFEGHALPWLPLETFFSRPERRGGLRPGVVVRAGESSALISVDGIRGVQDAVARPLPDLTPSHAWVAGAGFDVDGHPCLVLNPEGLVRTAHTRQGALSPPVSQVRPPLLIVDDSLTTRMLEQSILESAGYEVECAVSAEEALARATKKRYGLFLVDVEMPGMDGFELLEKFRADPGLRDIPAILVTSRSSSESRWSWASMISVSEGSTSSARATR
jgi:two-component system chemotaxis sensor kinase CheA